MRPKAEALGYPFVAWRKKSKNGRQQVPRFARNDNFLWKLSKERQAKEEADSQRGMTERNAKAKATASARALRGWLGEGLGFYA
jgi:hypothetical protein